MLWRRKWQPTPGESHGQRSLVGYSPRVAKSRTRLSDLTSLSYRIYRRAIQKKDLNDPDNHNGVITYLDPDILEYEVQWALGSITRNKASGGNEFQLSYFKSWKMMLWKCCTQYVSKFGKLSSGHRTGKGQFSFPCQRKEMPKNAQTAAQLYSSHMLVK